MENKIFNLNFDEIIENIYLNKYDKEINNPLWKLFLTNNGLMTLSLTSLFGKDELSINVLPSNFHFHYLKLEEILSKKIYFSENYLERLIEFKVKDSTIMYGLSFWDKNVY